MRFEILNANDEDVSSRALELVKTVTQSLSFGLREATEASPLSRFLKVVTDTCSKELKDPEAKMARPAGKVLATCASTGPAANEFIVKRSVPQLIKLFRESNSVNKRTAVLDILNGFLEAVHTMYAEMDPELNPIMGIKDDLFEIYSKGFLGSGSEETTYRLAALDGFRKLSSLRGILSNNELGIVVQYYDDVALRDENEDTWYFPNRVN